MNADTVTIIGPGLLEVYLARIDEYHIIDVRTIDAIHAHHDYLQVKYAGAKEMGTRTDAIYYPLDDFRMLMRRSLCITKEQLAEELGLDLLGALP